ncbi:alpha/beta hydrolase [Hyphomonas johnsonii]|nr:alpha/beta fold hydrolase [Hyphomonas johnsonii]
MSNALLMIHGIGCGGDVWDRMQPGFEAAGWRCEAPTLFPDQRTVDAPPPTLPDLGFDDYVDAMVDAARALAKETGRKPAVIGHSMGGLIAQCLAERGEVSQAVFLTPAQPKDCAVVGLPVVYTFLNILLARNRAKSYKVWRSGFRFGVVNQVPRRRHDEIYARARFDSGKVYGDIVDGIEIDASLITIPTLTIAASRDRATLARAVRKVGEKYAKAAVPGDFFEYPDNAHWIVDEPGTDKVVEDIVAWLEQSGDAA